MPFGNVLLVAFFFLTSIAATTAMLSLVEVPVAYFSEEHGVSRPKAAIINGLVIIAFGVLATLSVDKESLLGGITIFGRSFFDIFDYLSSNVLLPLGGLLIALFIGYAANKEDVYYELSNQGTLQVASFIKVFFFIVRYITPALLLIVFLNSIGIIK